jgi:hypothetical protein
VRCGKLLVLLCKVVQEGQVKGRRKQAAPYAGAAGTDSLLGSLGWKRPCHTALLHTLYMCSVWAASVVVYPDAISASKWRVSGMCRTAVKAQ